ncbi:MAG: peptide chain release factor N(5)-glutamine methyltransferase [Alphaproteobacteria bacterium]|nr:peptide chain release factor N(5)-glutamine methyltransferase [Alphaproteobacteria bacterium]
MTTLPLPMTLKNIYREMKDALQEAMIEMPALDARIIVEERAGLEWADIIAKGEEIEIEAALCEQMRGDVMERISGRPLSRIYNKREFWGLEFKLSPDTLDPRPETELIVELALQRFTGREVPRKILDLGTGSGCILIALLSEFSNSEGIGVDLSEGALDIARYNAQQNGCGSRAKFIHGSWWDAVDAQHDAKKDAHNTQQKFDLVVSNPPYISNHVIQNLAPEVKNHDPILGLDGGNEGLDAYKIIFSKLKTHLFPDGIALLEIGYDQENDVVRLSKESGFALRTVHADLAGNPRVVEISCGDK